MSFYFVWIFNIRGDGGFQPQISRFFAVWEPGTGNYRFWHVLTGVKKGNKTAPSLSFYETGIDDSVTATYFVRMRFLPFYRIVLSISRWLLVFVRLHGGNSNLIALACFYCDYPELTSQVDFIYLNFIIIISNLCCLTGMMSIFTTLPKYQKNLLKLINMFYYLPQVFNDSRSISQSIYVILASTTLIK